MQWNLFCGILRIHLNNPLCFVLTYHRPCVYLLCSSLCRSDSGTSGLVRLFRNMTVTWELSTPSPLLMRIVGLWAHQTTRVLEFGSGKYRATAWNTDPVFGIWVCCFIVFVAMPSSKAYNPTPQYQVVNNGRLRLRWAAAQRNLSALWTYKTVKFVSVLHK